MEQTKEILILERFDLFPMEKDDDGSLTRHSYKSTAPVESHILRIEYSRLDPQTGHLQEELAHDYYCKPDAIDRLAEELNVELSSGAVRDLAKHFREKKS